MRSTEENDRRNLEAETLIHENLRLVLKIANDFLGRGLPWDDLVSEGNRGLVIAAHRFNPDVGAKFSTYSAWWIKQAIRQVLDFLGDMALLGWRPDGVRIEAVRCGHAGNVKFANLLQDSMKISN